MTIHVQTRTPEPRRSTKTPGQQCADHRSGTPNVKGAWQRNETKRNGKRENESLTDRKRENDSQVEEESKDQRRRRTPEAKSSSRHDRTSIG